MAGWGGLSSMLQGKCGEVRMAAKGIQFLVDAKGIKSAVVIDLRRHRRVWEDFYDLLITQSRQGEPRLSWDKVRARAGKTVRKRA